MEKLKLSILISGNGSNLQALIDACQEADFPTQIVHVISNNKNALGIKRAEKASIPVTYIDHRDFLSREDFDEAIDNILRQNATDLICLAGFMRVLTDWFCKKWQDKIINIHPSLLPAFRGQNAQKQALDAGVKITGCTVHFVRPEMDAGPIILQAAVNVLEGDNEESLSARILEQEHHIYKQAVRLIAENKVKIKNERCFLD